jgi:nitroreductase
MNEVLKHIFERRAVRKYKHMSVDKDVIEMLLDAGRMAPSAMNRQPWKFYVLSDRKKIKAFSKEIAAIAVKQIKHVSLKELAKMTLSFFHLSTMVHFLEQDDHIFYGAPVVIFITSPLKDEWGALDVGMCAQNIMLAAKSMGLDTCPVGFAKFVSQTKDYYQLNIPASEQVDLAIIVGYGDESPKSHERIENNAVFIH